MVGDLINNSHIEFIDQLVLNKLSLFNLFVGCNSTGKSTALKLINENIDSSVYLNDLLPLKYSLSTKLSKSISETIIQDINGILKQILPDSYSLLSIHNSKIYLNINHDSLSKGLVRFINIFLTLIHHQDTIIIIDELENSFHYSIYKHLVSILYKLSIENNNKLCISTHNLELLDSFIFYEASDLTISLFRLEKVHKNINIIYLDKDRLIRLRSLGQEIR